MTITKEGEKASKGSSEPGGPRRHMVRAQRQVRASEEAKIASKADGKVLEPRSQLGRVQNHGGSVDDFKGCLTGLTG